MTDLRRSGSSSIFSCQNRDPIKLSVHSGTAHRRRQNAVAIGKERRNALMRTKRLRLDGVDCNDDGVLVEGSGMIVDQRNIDLNAQISRAVEGLRSSISFVGQGSAQKISQTLCYLRQILSNSGAPPVEVAIQAGAVPILGHCLLVCLPDEQLLDAAWCLTNIAAGESEQTKAILPALPMLIANLGEKSSVSVREQCAWALGNAASEECLRNTLVSHGALLPLALMLQSDNSSLARISAWTLCNLIKGSDSNTAMELIMINGVSEAIIKNLKNVEDELSTEVSWIVTYLSALSQNATSILVRNGIIPLLVENLQKSKSLNSIIPILRSLGNCVVGDSHTINGVLLAGQNITNDLISLLVKYMESEHNRFMKKKRKDNRDSTEPSEMYYRFSNRVIGYLNLLTLLGSIPIIGGGLWLAKTSSTCQTFLQTPLLVLGFVILLVSLMGFVGACFNIVWALWLYLVTMLFLIAALLGLAVFGFAVASQGGGIEVPGRVYKEYRLTGYSKWMKDRVRDAGNWDTVKTCLLSSKACRKISTWTPLDYMEKDLTPIQSGCCKPPTSCDYGEEAIGKAAQDGDCYHWSNAVNVLCYSCNSCKAAVLEEARREWHKLSVLIIVVLVFLIAVYSIGCCAFRNARRSDTTGHGYYGHNPMSKVRPRWDFYWWRRWYDRRDQLY